MLLERQEDLLEKVESELVIVGSSLQALGYILQIIASNYDDGEERENQSKLLDRIGIELLALGNISNVIGIYFNINEQLKENDYLIITGNSLQSIGALGVEATLVDINVLQKIIILGNSMQSLGAGLQAYQGVLNVLKDEKENKDSIFDKKDERIIALIGIWIQAIGTLISAIGITAIEEENRLENNEKSEILI